MNSPVVQEPNKRPLLELRGVSADKLGSDRVRLIHDVDLTVNRSEIRALVGESGSGKTITALSVLKLLPRRVIGITSGEILFEGTDLLKLGTRALSEIRGRRVAMIFQEPLSSLNPVITIGDQITEVLTRHHVLRGAAARRRAVELLDEVRIPQPDKRVNDYPHQLSGGMQQRAMIAMAIACNPSMLIADEPTTALDVTVQAQIMELLATIQKSHGMSILLITHDLGVVSEFAENVSIMYAGRIVESGSVRDTFSHPKHPYAEALLNCVASRERDSEYLVTIQGNVPSPHSLPPGCTFEPRCRYAIAECRTAVPALRRAGGTEFRCIRDIGAMGAPAS